MSFAKDLNKFSLKAISASEKRTREICFRLGNEVIEGTPDDTGETRLNWQGSINQPASGVKNSLGSSQSNTIQAFTQIKEAAKLAPGNIFYLTNNTVQATVLEFGLYPNPPKKGTYLKAGESKRGRTGPGHYKFSSGGYSNIAKRGMVRIAVKKLASDYQ